MGASINSEYAFITSIFRVYEKTIWLLVTQLMWLLCKIWRFFHMVLPI